MRRASTRLRLGQRSFSLALAIRPSCRDVCEPSCTFSTAVFPSLRPSILCDRPRDAQKRQPNRAHWAAASAAPLRPSQDDSAAQGNVPEPSTTITANRQSTCRYPSHIVPRGPLLPAEQPAKAAAPRSDGAYDEPRATHRPHDRLMLSTEHYGKWRELIFNYDQLMFESGLVSASVASHRAARSVDQPEHACDLRLWSAIFNFAQRRGASDGAVVVWREIFQRKQLHEVDGVVARAFWLSVLEAALDDDAFLESTWAYAEWMYGTHGALWPGYYLTVVTHFLDNGEYDRALHWHVRLSAHFAVAKRDFFGMLKDFLTDPDPELQETLRYMYVTSQHRALYDTIVPLLWSRGHSALARAWRETLIHHDDRPMSSASRPFLQYLVGYYPETDLCAQEQEMASSRPAQYLAPPVEQPVPTAPDMPTNLFHLMNRVHGETFGIREKAFNDKIGSQWFATGWVSLDTAINLVYSLGISEIGPLSLQSIALREGTPASVVRRLEQLERFQISIGRANYSKAVRHLAKTGDAETLRELLHSTLHPDVFDDVVLQRYVLGSTTYMSDWKTHRLLLVVRLAVAEDAEVATSNQLLLACLRRKKTALVLRLLDEFAARGIELLPSTCQNMTRIILEDAPRRFDPNAAPDVDFYGALCRRLAALRLPVATEAWQNILLILGRQGRLTDLEKVALDIVSQYVALQTAVALPRARPLSSALSSSAAASLPSSDDSVAAFKVHITDVPDAVRGQEGRPEDEDLGYRLLPRDLPMDHPLHPLSLIFNQSLVESIVRWYFHRKGAYRQSRGARLDRLTHTRGPRQPHDFSLAGGIRLAAMLRDRGVAISRASIRAEVLVCIAALLGPQSLATRYWRPARSANQLTMGEIKALCEAAWAGPEAAGTEPPLLPPLAVLETALEAIKPVASTLESQITRPSDRNKASREAFMDAVAGQS